MRGVERNGSSLPPSISYHKPAPEPRGPPPSAWAPTAPPTRTPTPYPTNAPPTKPSPRLDFLAKEKQGIFRRRAPSRWKENETRTKRTDQRAQPQAAPKAAPLPWVQGELSNGTTPDPRAPPSFEKGMSPSGSSPQYIRLHHPVPLLAPPIEAIHTRAQMQRAILLS